VALLEIEHLSVRLGSRKNSVYPVADVSFSIADGETVGLVGESGCGKTMTSLAIAGLLPASVGRVSEGHIRFGGLDLTTVKERQMRAIRGDQIAMIFQDPMTSLNPVITIGEQIREALQAHDEISRDAADARAVELLGMVGMSDAAATVRAFPHQLSGGMRQRVLIAIALALRPRLLIADEPTTALDATIEAQVLDLLRDLTTQLGTALLIITHDLGVVADMAQRVVVMYAGRIVEIGPTQRVFADPGHPYTAGLLDSVPDLEMDKGSTLKAIEGTPPSLRTMPSGCRFAPRCPRRLDVCTTVEPALEPRQDPAIAAETERRLACHNPAPAVKEADSRD
jgi:oligopeptide/dipeptide ABC transporter ATP-binding protein